MSIKNWPGGFVKPIPPTVVGGRGSAGSAKGVWTLEQATNQIKQGLWQTPGVVPGAPTIGTATAGNNSATVAFTAPADNGGFAVTGYTATSSPGGITGTGASSPVTVTGLTNGTPYTFTVTATNYVGTGAASAASNSVTPAVPDLGIFIGGRTLIAPSTVQATARYVNISSLGNSLTWGNLASGQTYVTASGGASTTRAVWGGGLLAAGTNTNVIQYATFATTATLSDFGDLTAVRQWCSGGSNSTRALFYGGRDGSRSNIIDYVTIATTGNATDFGDTVQYGQDGGASYTSTTEFFYAGGERDGYNNTSTRYRLIIATTGNTAFYGNLSASRDNCQGASNSTYGIVGGGVQSSPIATIDRHTMSSSGDSTFFGNLTTAQANYGCAGNSTRIIFYGGNNFVGSVVNPIYYVQYATTGNAVDFGDINAVGADDSIYNVGGASNAHGGL